MIYIYYSSEYVIFEVKMALELTLVNPDAFVLVSPLYKSEWSLEWSLVSTKGIMFWLPPPREGWLDKKLLELLPIKQLHNQPQLIKTREIGIIVI